MSRPKILLAEDESILRMDLKEMVTEAGYEVAGEASDGEEAVEKAFKIRPDLIIMDIKMPKMNGLKAARIITRSLRIPILLLTAYSQKELIREAREAFVTGYLVKPIRETDLLPAIEVSLGQAERLASLRNEVKRLEWQLEERKLVERAKGLLMKKYGWSEEKAYRSMRKTSMEKQVSLGELARRILKQYEPDFRVPHK